MPILDCVYLVFSYYICYNGYFTKLIFICLILNCIILNDIRKSYKSVCFKTKISTSTVNNCARINEFVYYVFIVVCNLI